MRRTTVSCAVLAAVLAAGCSTSGEGTGKSAGISSSASASASASQAGAGLAAKWGPKLASATAGEAAVCNEVGDHACAEHLTDIALAVGELEQDVTQAGGASAYPRTVAEVERVNTAVAAYTEHECLGDENAGIPGSPCPDDVQAILGGGKALPLALQADEGA